MITFQIGDCVIEADKEGCTTTFGDGRQVRAEPQDADDYRATAASHGYVDDVWRMCVEHELLHTALAKMLGLPWSPTLRGVAMPEEALSPRSQWAEEAAVLSIQRWVNELRAAGIPTEDYAVPPVKCSHHPEK